jgi:hypothetical protein
MEHSLDIQGIIKEADAKFPNDIPFAVDWADKKLRSCPEFNEWTENFIRHSIQEMIYDVRHQKSHQIKAEAGGYINPTKVSASSSTGNAAIAKVYEYRIAGRTLGMLLGNELAAIASSEREIAHGHLFNCQLCEELKRLVPDDKTVRQAVPEVKLRGLFKRLQKQSQVEAA